jgi:hypothetical protein
LSESQATQLEKTEPTELPETREYADTYEFTMVGGAKFERTLESYERIEDLLRNAWIGKTWYDRENFYQVPYITNVKKVKWTVITRKGSEIISTKEYLCGE